MDGFTFALERNRLLIEHEEATRQTLDDSERAELEARLAADLLLLYRRLEGCGGVGIRDKSGARAP